MVAKVMSCKHRWKVFFNRNSIMLLSIPIEPIKWHWKAERKCTLTWFCTHDITYCSLVLFSGKWFVTCFRRTSHYLFSPKADSEECQCSKSYIILGAKTLVSAFKRGLRNVVTLFKDKLWLTQNVLFVHSEWSCTVQMIHQCATRNYEHRTTTTGQNLRVQLLNRT